MKNQLPEFFKKNYAPVAFVAGLVVCGVCIACSLKSLSAKSKNVSLNPYGDSSEYAATPEAVVPEQTILQAPADDAASYLLSEKRFFCKAGSTNDSKRACGRPFPAAKLDKDKPVCPYCRILQPMSQREIKLNKDANGNGIPDDWEKKYGVKPGDEDKDLDGDGFTVMEEFNAETDPSDKDSHPDYFASLSMSGEVKKETMPIYCSSVNKMSKIWRFDIRSCANNVSYGQVAQGEPVTRSDKFGKRSPIGWSVTNYVEKIEMRKVGGESAVNGKALERPVDVSTIVFVREKDGKRITVPVGPRGKGFEFEKTVKLSFSRPQGFNGGDKSELTVREGDEFTLYAEKFRVEKIADGSVIVKNLTTGVSKEYK